MRRPFGALVVLIALPVAACGGGEDAATVEQAAQATRQAESARVGWRVTTKGFGLPRDVTVEGAGTTDLDAPRMDLSFDLAPILKLTGGGSPGGRADVVVRGRDVYVRPRGFRLPGGRRWVALDLVQALEASGEDARGLGEVLTLDPDTQIDVLRAAEDVEEVGTESVAGTQTTRYRGQLSLSAYAKGLPAERRERAQAAIERFSAETGGEQAQPFEVWIDGDDRIRRMRQTSKVPSSPGVPPGEVGITMELSDFGAAVDADPPAKDETYDATGPVSDALEAAQ